MASQRPRKPDWKFWRDIVDIDLGRAIHLSLNVCPDRTDAEVLEQHEQSRGYQDRLAIADSNLMAGKLEPRSVASAPRSSTTRLADFAAFAVSKGWKIPQGLSELAVEPAKAAPKEDKPVGQKERDVDRVLLAACLKALGIEWKQPTKNDGRIELLTRDIAAPVSISTIEDRLKQIPEALARRSK